MMRVFGLCLLSGLVMSGAARAGALAHIKSGEIWQHCEAYFNDVETLRKRARHYKIRDRSLAFMKFAKTLKPATEKEAFLFVECINLANGNAHRAHTQIRANEAEDDKFFRLAENEATNNSNAKQHEYLSKLDKKYEFDLETEEGKQRFNADLEASRLSALQVVALSFNIAMSAFGIPGIGIDLGYNNSGGNPSSGTFGRVANTANQKHTNADQAGAASGTFTPAPVGPSEKAKEETTATVEEARVVPPTDIVQPVQNDNAPHVGNECVSYKLSDDGLVATVTNSCAFPVEWRWCWVPSGKNECTPNSLSGIIPPKEEVVVSGPDDGASRKAKSVVCNMSDADKFCRL